MKKSSDGKSAEREIRNKRAFHDYFVDETFEAGIVLRGAEVKSLRAGHAQISDAFVRGNRLGELFLYNAEIAGYKFCDDAEYNHTRPRKLLLHSSEIKKILVALERDRSPVIPLKIFFKGNLAKVDIAICRGKKLFDKRETLKKKEALRDAERAMSMRTRGMQ
ncbi:MAG: SsrA-binding protein SmpB [Puniceicoccales bacterium]|nr:SsrA-binding protein SmpB [Puniceicoccales bacterium]